MGTRSGAAADSWPGCRFRRADARPLASPRLAPQKCHEEPLRLLPDVPPPSLGRLPFPRAGAGHLESGALRGIRGPGPDELVAGRRAQGVRAGAGASAVARGQRPLCGGAGFASGSVGPTPCRPGERAGAVRGGAGVLRFAGVAGDSVRPGSGGPVRDPQRGQRGRQPCAREHRVRGGTSACVAGGGAGAREMRRGDGGGGGRRGAWSHPEHRQVDRPGVAEGPQDPGGSRGERHAVQRPALRGSAGSLQAGAGGGAPRAQAGGGGGPVRPPFGPGGGLALTRSRSCAESAPRRWTACRARVRDALQERGLARVGSEPEPLVGELGGHSALRGPVEVAFHDEVRFVDLLDGVRLLAHGNRQ